MHNFKNFRAILQYNYCVIDDWSLPICINDEHINELYHIEIGAIIKKYIFFPTIQIL